MLCAMCGRFLLIAALLALVACGPSSAPPHVTLVPTNRIAHAVIGTWSMPLDGRDGFKRTFRADGTVSVWWPDGRLAAEGRFDVIDTQTVSVVYPNRDTDVVRLLEDNLIRIERVELDGNHRKYHAQREVAAPTGRD
jgi:hypothetical protein